MGKVFSWNEIEEGKIPAINDFHIVCEKMKLKFSEMREIVGAAICGSILNEGIDIRSDIDAVIVYSESSRSIVIKAMQSLSLVAQELNVPIELVLISDGQARRSGHGIDRSFWEHLEHSVENNGVIKINPQELIETKDTVLRDTKYCIARKGSVLEKRWARASIEDAGRYHFLEKLLSAPVYVARKVLRCHNSDLLKNGDSKKKVLEAYSNLFGDNPMVRLLHELVAFDKVYTEHLKMQIKEPQNKLYVKMLEEIEEQAPNVLLFLQENYRFLEDLE